MAKERIEDIVDKILKPDPQVMKGLRKHLKFSTPFLEELFGQEQPVDCEGTPRIRIVVAPPKSFKTTFCFWLVKEQILRDAGYTGLYISADDRRERLEAWVREYGLEGRLSTRRVSHPVGLQRLLKLPYSHIYIDPLPIIVEFHILSSVRDPTLRYYYWTYFLSSLSARLEQEGKHLTLTYHSSVKQKDDLREDPRSVLRWLYGDTTGLVAGASEVIGIQREGDDRLWTFRISKEGEGRNLYRMVSSQSGVPLLEEIDWEQEMNAQISKERAEILEYLKEHKKVKRKNLAEALGTPDDTVRKRLQRFRKDGYVTYDPTDNTWSLTPFATKLCPTLSHTQKKQTKSSGYKTGKMSQRGVPGVSHVPGGCPMGHGWDRRGVPYERE